MKIIVIGGAPATGKSAIVETIIKEQSEGKGQPAITDYKGMVYTKIPTGYVLGTYEPGNMFPGTDGLSMSVMPLVKEFLGWVHSSNPKAVVLFEGDRLFTRDFLVFCSTITEVKIFVLVTPPDLTVKRIHERQLKGKPFNLVFYRGRVTKISRILKEVPGISILKNGNESEFRKNIGLLQKEINT